MQHGAASSLSPSFNSYSNTNLVEIAARVVEEFRAENNSGEFYDDFYIESRKRDGEMGDENIKDEEIEVEFEFATKGAESSPISADEIFDNGKIRPVYPVFGARLFVGGGGKIDGDDVMKEEKKGANAIRLSLRKLFIEERETATTSSSSSSDADELDSVPAETYCVWRPKTAAAVAPLKSNSTGSASKRWKLKDFLLRSRSEGSKDGVVLLTTSNSGRKGESEHKTKEKMVVTAKVAAATTPTPPSLYNRDGGEKRRTYLPYRQDLVGFF